MIGTVIANYKWTIDKVKELYLADDTFEGLDFHYEHISEQHKQIRASRKKK